MAWNSAMHEGRGVPRTAPEKRPCVPDGRSRFAALLAIMLAAGSLVSPASAGEAQALSASTIRETQTGKVQGLDGDVMSFRGIPYASPPMGPLRWRAPGPPERWTGVRSATQFGSDCFGSPHLRKGSLAPGPSEDCLYLNVWAPRDASPGRYPVMVWIYGGGFTGGSAAMPFYDGEALAKQGVVVVTFNYRTNILGFFAHPALSRESGNGVSGNYGLLDVLAALRWVQENAGAFGGDRDRVTVFGESAGASAIGLLLTSPLSQGLFSGAILESPGLMRPLATLAESSAAGEQLGSDLTQLRATDPAALMARAASTIPASRNLRQPRPIGPIIDGVVLPRSDGEAIAAGALASVPVIIGSNADEGRIFVDRAPVETAADYQAYLQTQFGDQAGALARCYPVTADAEVKATVSRVFGDNQFNNGIDAFSAALSRRSTPVFRYRFNGNTGDGRLPATHGEEIPFVFNTLIPDEVGLFSWLPRGGTPHDQALARAMSRAWTTFAKRGDPNGDGPVVWPAYKPGGQIMTFGPTGAAKAQPEPKTNQSCVGRAQTP